MTNPSLALQGELRMRRPFFGLMSTIALVACGETVEIGKGSSAQKPGQGDPMTQPTQTDPNERDAGTERNPDVNTTPTFPTSLRDPRRAFSSARHIAWPRIAGGGSRARTRSLSMRASSIRHPMLERRWTRSAPSRSSIMFSSRCRPTFARFSFFTSLRSTPCPRSQSS